MILEESLHEAYRIRLTLPLRAPFPARISDFGPVLLLWRPSSCQGVGNLALLPMHLERDFTVKHLYEYGG